MLYTTIVHETRRELGISMEEWAVCDALFFLNAKGGKVVKADLAESLGLSLSSVKRHIAKAEETGLAKRWAEVVCGNAQTVQIDTLLIENGSNGAVKTIKTVQNDPLLPASVRRKERSKEKKNIYIYNNTSEKTVDIFAYEIYAEYVQGFAKDKRRFFEKARAIVYLEELLKEFKPEQLLSAAKAYKKAVQPVYWMSPQYFFSNSKAPNAKKYRPFVDYLDAEESEQDSSLFESLF